MADAAGHQTMNVPEELGGSSPRNGDGLVGEPDDDEKLRLSNKKNMYERARRDKFRTAFSDLANAMVDYGVPQARLNSQLEIIRECTHLLLVNKERFRMGGMTFPPGSFYYATPPTYAPPRMQVTPQPSPNAAQGGELFGGYGPGGYAQRQPTPGYPYPQQQYVQSPQYPPQQQVNYGQQAYQMPTQQMPQQQQFAQQQQPSSALMSPLYQHPSLGSTQPSLLFPQSSGETSSIPLPPPLYTAQSQQQQPQIIKTEPASSASSSGMITLPPLQQSLAQHQVPTLTPPKPTLPPPPQLANVDELQKRTQLQSSGGKLPHRHQPGFNANPYAHGGGGYAATGASASTGAPSSNGTNHAAWSHAQLDGHGVTLGTVVGEEVSGNDAA